MVVKRWKVRAKIFHLDSPSGFEIPQVIIKADTKFKALRLATNKIHKKYKGFKNLNVFIIDAKEV